jgi:glycine cleavage system H protein
MPLVLAFLTFVVFIGISLISERMKKRMAARPAPSGVAAAPQAAASVQPPLVLLPSTKAGVVRVEGYTMPESLYYHQGHTWVAPQDAATAVMGIDEFAGKLMGKPDSIKFPRVGKRYRQGEKVLSLRRDEKTLEVLCPIDGEVIAINGRAIESPDVLASEPYGAGWLVMFKTRDLQRNLRNLLSGEFARSWMEESAVQLRSMFAGSLGVVYQDGGLPEEGLATQLSAEDWKKLVKRNFMVDREDDIKL